LCCEAQIGCDEWFREHSRAQGVLFQSLQAPQNSECVDMAKNTIHCSVADCQYPNIALNPEHKRGACGKLVHRLCAEEKELIDINNEDVGYYSVTCKERSALILK
jgi:hypothetical protein